MRPVANVIVLSLLIIAAVAQVSNGQKPRVFVSDSQSWQVSGNSGGSSSGFGSHFSGGARPQTAEIIKTFADRCPEVTINNKQDKADYVVLLDHEGGKGLALRDNKVAVFNGDGDSIVSHSTRSLGNAVKDACQAIQKDWPSRSAKVASSSQGAQLTLVSAKSVGSPVSAKSADAPAASQVVVSSVPPNADIELDGNFVGSTPSTIEIAPGEHSVLVKKAGYRDWQRSMKITGGSINIAAELERAK
jgi:hypothetical protein